MSPAHDLLQSLVGQTNEGCKAGTPLRGLVWTRVSTDMQGERGTSVEQQLREIRDYAGRQGIEIVEEYSEVASAFQREDRRVEFARMLERAKSDSAINAILVHDYSRFSRDSIRARALVRELRQFGVQVLSVTDPVFDSETSSGVWVEGVTFLKNEAFSRDVSFHTKKGCRANVQTRDPETSWCYKNGGQPLWGYRAAQLTRGEERKGKPIRKSIWVLDDTIVAGRPLHEWVRHCLVELAARGASLNELRDFCEETGLPARRRPHWGTSTWNALLGPHILLKYCGHEVWNVHRKNGSTRPSSEWTIVENAHPAIITSEEAQQIAAVRRQNRQRGVFFTPGGQSRTSPYLLSGGLFKCGRCNANMTGLKLQGGTYYVCGSLPYRRGRGCGKGVYVPVDLVEGEVLEGLGQILGACADPKGFTRGVNDEIRRLWREQQQAPPAEATEEIATIDSKIANVRTAIEDGLADTAWANARLQELSGERQRLSARATQSGEPPQISVEEAMRYRRDTEKLFQVGTITERKELIRQLVEQIQLAPERLQIEVTYRVPEHFMKTLVAGAGFEPATFGL